MIHYINRTECHGFTESNKRSMKPMHFHFALKLNIMYYYTALSFTSHDIYSNAQVAYNYRTVKAGCSSHGHLNKSCFRC